MTALTDRYTLAVDYVRIAHAAQVRKGSGIPYIYHLLGVSSLVLEFGGNEDQAIAGLLHDVVEDCGAIHAVIVRKQFGDAVADIVDACTDGSAESKQAVAKDPASRKRDWLERKQAYIGHLKHATDDVLLVSACDKLHNARAIVQDMQSPDVGVQVFDRFTGGLKGSLGYYHELSQIFDERDCKPAPAFERTVARMHALADVTSRQGLPFELSE